MPGPWDHDKANARGNPQGRRRNRLTAYLASLPPRRRYLIFTFAFVALVTALLLAGQLLLLAILLLVCLVYAPQIVEWVAPGRGQRR